MKLPKYIYRKDDGERFTLQEDGKYTMDKSEMFEPYRYSITLLTNSAFVTDKRDIRIVETIRTNIGCGGDGESC